MKTRALLFGTALVASLAGQAALADALRLRAEAIVEGDVVQLGQLIEGIEKGAEIPVFRAPAPGTRGTIRADRVIAAAREMGITGADKITLGGVEAVRIIRPGRVVSRHDMQNAIARAFSERGARGDVEVVLDDHLQPRMFDLARTEELRVVSLLNAAPGGRFEARIALSGDTTGDSWVVTGTMMETREIAVLSVDAERGEAIQKRDLTFIKRRVGTLPQDLVASADDLVGMVPRRPLRAGEPIRGNDLAKPILVEKNQIISVVYSAPGVTLSMRGRAQSSGSKGETIRVQNLSSKRFIEGTVTGPAQITITSPAAPQPVVAAADVQNR